MTFGITTKVRMTLIKRVHILLIILLSHFTLILASGIWLNAIKFYTSLGVSFCNVSFFWMWFGQVAFFRESFCLVSFFVMCHSSECGSAKWHSSEYHSAWCHSSIRCVVLVIIILLSVILLGVIVLDVILLNVVSPHNLQSNIHDFFIFCKKDEIKVFFLFQKSFFSKIFKILFVLSNWSSIYTCVLKSHLGIA